MRKKVLLYVGGGVVVVFLAIAFYSLLSADTMNYGSNSNQAFECGSYNYSDTSCGTSRNAICNLDLCGWTNRFAITWDDFDDGRGIGIENSDITGGDVTGSGTQGRFSFFQKENSETSMGWAYTERNWDWDTYTGTLNKMCNASVKFDYSVYSTDWDESDLNSQLDAFLVPQDKTSGGLRYSCMPDRATYYTGSQCAQGTWGPINNDFGTGNVCCGRSDGVAIRFEGWVNATSAGNHTFRVGGDDGIRLTMDGTWCAGDYSNHGYTTYTCTRNLSAGYHPIMLEYYEDGSGARVSLEWCGPSTTACGTYSAIAAGNLYYSNWYKLKGPERETTDDAYYYGGTPPNSGHIHIEDPSNAGNNPNLSYNDESITSIYPCNKGGDCTAIKLAKFFNDYGATSKEHALRFWMSVKNPSNSGNNNWLKWSIDDARVDYTIDTTVPTCSWSGSGFGTYDTDDGAASATTSCSDANCGLRVNSEYGDGEAVNIAKKVNDVWSYYCADATWQTDSTCASNGGLGWQTNGTGCSVTGGQDNKYIQCAVKARDKAYSPNISGWTYTTNTLVDFNRPRVSDLSANNFYFSPNASSGSKDTTTILGRTCDSASTVNWYNVTIKDTSGNVKRNLGNTTCGAHNACAQSNTCSACASGDYCSLGSPGSEWDGKDDSSVFVAEGTYNAYVTSRDKAAWDSPAGLSDNGKTCTTETITTGTSISGTHTDTHDNAATTRVVRELASSVGDNGKDCTSIAVNRGQSISGTHSDTHTNNGTVWNINETCVDWNSCCGADWDVYFNTSISDSGITRIDYMFEMQTEDDTARLWLWNYDTSSWTDAGNQVGANHNDGDTHTYTICGGGSGRSCPPYVSSSGNIVVGWTDSDMGSCWENSDFFKIDNQYVDITYNDDKLDLRYVFETSVAKDLITKVELQTDAYSTENMSIWRYNYNTPGWENTGQSTSATETLKTFDLCSGSCANYINDTGAVRQVQIKYDDNVNVDNTTHNLNVEYHTVNITYGSSLVTVIVDNTSPGTTLSTYTPDPTISDTLDYTGQGDDPVSGTVNSPLEKVECKVDAGAYSASTASDGAWDETTEDYSYNTGALAEGSHTVSCRSVDMAGNTDATDAADTVCVDLTAPTVTFNSPAGSSWQKANFTTDLTNADTPSCSGLSTCEYRVISNGVETKAWTALSPCTTDPAITVGAAADCRDEGTDMCTVVVRLIDNAARQTTSLRNFSIDWTNPTFGTVTPANTATATHVDGTFDVSTTFADATSNVASCEYCKATDGTCDTEWTSGTWSAGTCSVTGLTCTDGQSLTLNMRATDNAANVGTAASVARTCDTVAPSFTITSWDTGCAGTQYTNNESYADSSPSFCYSATDGGASPAGLHATTPYTYVFGTDCSAAPSTTTTSASYGASGLTNATKNCFRVYATDAVNNSSSTSTFTYMYNTQAPSWRYPGVGSTVGPFYGGGTIRTYGAEQRFYAASNGGVMYAVNAADGAEKWQCELDISPDNGSITNCGASDYGPVVSPPLVFGGKIYLGTYYGYVLKFTDTGSGWTLDAERDLGVCSIQSATLTITMSGATKILVGCADSMYALNDDATFTNWANWTTNPRPLTGSVTRSIPAYAVLPGGTDPYLYAATQNGTLADGSYGNLYKIDINNGSILNTFGDSTDFTGFLILRNYFGDGNQWLYAGGANSNKFYAIKTSSVPATCTGASCVSFAASSGFEGGSAVSSGGSVVYAGNNNGTLYRLNFNGTTLTSPYNFDAGGAANAIKYGITFRQATGRLYFGTDAGLFFTITDNGASFTENTRYHTGDSVSATPAVNAASGKVVIPGVIGRIFSFGL